jgi:hypothetical protein
MPKLDIFDQRWRKKQGLTILPSREARLNALLRKRPRKTSLKRFRKRREELDQFKDGVSRWMQKLCKALDVVLDEEIQRPIPKERRNRV